MSASEPQSNAKRLSKHWSKVFRSLSVAWFIAGTPLIHEYHSKVLGRLAKLLNLYGQAQASRLGLNVIQPADAHQNGENGDVQG